MLQAKAVLLTHAFSPHLTFNTVGKYLIQFGCNAKTSLSPCRLAQFLRFLRRQAAPLFRNLLPNSMRFPIKRFCRQGAFPVLTLKPNRLNFALQEILRTLGKAAEVYTRKNLRMLYDAISTLADGVGPALGKPSLLALFMPPLLVKWQQFADSDRELMPLMEVFTALATALGEPPPPLLHYIPYRVAGVRGCNVKWPVR